MNQNISYRSIKIEDNKILASIIRSGIEAFNLPTVGTAHSDPTTDDLFLLFTKENSGYIVLEIDGKVMGGCGVYPSNGLPNQHAELVRFFLDEQVRGKGFGKILMQKCEELAKQFGYTNLYLESFPDMEAAVHLYEKFNYVRLENPLGNTGHFSCNVYMLKVL
ncbi:MAG: GNAT family N-acetyltransferase [Bacteroidia bacterium]|nr:GNAT family N-acetyltransferase [Bacteroidia bacterium]